LDLDPMRSEEAQRVEQKAQTGMTLFVGEDLRIGDARVIVDR
jgi:hypothetical protein